MDENGIFEVVVLNLVSWGSFGVGDRIVIVEKILLD